MFGKKYNLKKHSQTNPSFDRTSESDKELGKRRNLSDSDVKIQLSQSADLSDVLEGLEGDIDIAHDHSHGAHQTQPTDISVPSSHLSKIVEETDDTTDQGGTKNQESRNSDVDSVTSDSKPIEMKSSVPKGVPAKEKKTHFYAGADLDETHSNASYENANEHFGNENHHHHYHQNHSHSNPNFTRNQSDKDIHHNQSECSIHCGKDFRRTSTFVILPHTKQHHDYDVEAGGHHHHHHHQHHGTSDNMVCNVGQEVVDIKLVAQTQVPELFIEFDALYHDESSSSWCWLEKARWLRYEEDYDSELRRFDNPHLSPMSLTGLTDFKKLFAEGSVKLDCHSEVYAQVLNEIVDSLQLCEEDDWTEEEINAVRVVMTQRHYHAGEDMPNCEWSHHHHHGMHRHGTDEGKLGQSQSTSSGLMHRKKSKAAIHKENSSGHISKKATSTHLNECLSKGTESLSVQVGALRSLSHVHSWFIRLDPPIMAEGINEVNCPLRFVYVLLGPKTMEKQLEEVGRCFSIMMSNEKFRESVYAAENIDNIVNATNVFLQHSVLIPLPKHITQEAVSSMVPQLKAYGQFFTSRDHKKLCDQFCEGIKDQKKEVSIISHDQNTHQPTRRISISASKLSKAHLPDPNDLSFPSKDGLIKPDMDELIQKGKVSTASKIRDCCGLFCPPFRQLLYDLQGLGTRYASDFKDAFTKDNASTVFIGIVFIYFVVLSPAITFGALMNVEVSERMTVTLSLFGSGIFQAIYSVLTGNPLEIVGITGPIYVVEKVLSLLASDLGIQLELMRFWIGIYIALFGVIFLAINGTVVIKHFRRSVEEVFNFFAGFIFILNAVFGMFKKLPYSITDVTKLNATDENLLKIANEREKFAVGGATLFLALLMMNFCLMLVKIKRGSFFRRTIRNLLGSFNVPLGIILVVALERIFFQAFNMPVLSVPPSNKINVSLWFNSPNFSRLVSDTSPAAHAFCFAIAISMFFIIFTESITNSISVCKTERKLQKPGLFSLNYFCTLILFPIISGFTGWPFVSGAMVRSNAHCLAMSKWSTKNLPGVPPKITGAVEQRISGILVGILVFLSIFLGSVLQYIPMAAMYGMFLYMGVMGVRDMIVTKRIINLFQRRKHWDQSDYLKGYPTWNIAVFVSIQFFFILILIVLNIISDFTPFSWVALIFPGFVGIYAFLRGYILPLWPRLNTHLSKMDKKHPVELYAGLKAEKAKKDDEQIVVVFGNANEGDVHVDIDVVKKAQYTTENQENEETSDTDSEHLSDTVW